MPCVSVLLPSSQVAMNDLRSVVTMRKARGLLVTRALGLRRLQLLKHKRVRWEIPSRSGQCCSSPARKEATEQARNLTQEDAPRGKTLLARRRDPGLHWS